MTFQVFGVSRLSDYLAERLALVSKEVAAQAEEYILSVSADDYRAHLVDKFSIETPVFLVQEKTMDRTQRMVPAEHFPFNYNVYPGKGYPRSAYIIHIPVSGESHLVKYQPSHHLVWSYDVTLSKDALTFEVVPFTEDGTEIRRLIDGIISNLEQQLGHLSGEINNFNMNLEHETLKLLDTRRHKIHKEREVVEGIGIPLRKRDDIPATFAVPAPRTPKKIRPRPEVTTVSSPPDPTLADKDYRDILRVIHDMGVNLERYPSTHEGKDEESIRDYILLVLQPQFEGSATGETFNKSGKTDILLRYENRNVFVAECKFWTGPKGLLEAVSQLLGYLTWRDSKAALVLFVRNKAFSKVLEAVEANIPEHPQFGELVRRNEDSWLEYHFTLPDDPDRRVTLTVLAFHVPTRQND